MACTAGGCSSEWRPSSWPVRRERWRHAQALEIKRLNDTEDIFNVLNERLNKQIGTTSFFDAKLPSFFFEKVLKRESKMLCRNWENYLGGTLNTLHLVLGLKDTFRGPRCAHFDLTWKPFGPHFQPLRPVLTPFPCQMVFAKHNASFVQQGSLFTISRSDQSPVLILIVHHSVIINTECPMPLTLRCKRPCI